MESPFCAGTNRYILPDYRDSEDWMFLYYVSFCGKYMILDCYDPLQVKNISLAYSIYLEDCELARLYGALPSELL